jgi:hypothetical protein
MCLVKKPNSTIQSTQSTETALAQTPEDDSTLEQQAQESLYGNVMTAEEEERLFEEINAGRLRRP